jgi:hypothetical protein
MKKSPSSTTTKLLAASLGLAVAGLTQQALATDSIWTGTLTGGSQDWQTATNWSTNPTIPSGAGDTATFNNNLTGNTTLLLNGAVTLGSLTGLDTNNELNIQNGTGGSITFDTGSVTVPTINSSRSGGVAILLYATVNGTNGLTITAPTDGEIRVNGSTNWAGFSGGLTIAQGRLSLQADANGTNVTLPTDERLTLGTTGTTNFNLNNRPATVASLVGTSSSFIYNSQAASSRTLTVGDTSTDANFAGTIGQKDDGTSQNLMAFAKQGTGTQTISGSIVGSTTVSVNTNGGTLVYSGATISTTGNTTVNSGSTLKISGTVSQGSGANAGRIFVQGGATLTSSGANATIVLSDTNAGSTGLSVTGTTTPGGNGSIGTLTLVGTKSVRAVAAFETGSTFTFDLGAGLASDQIAVTGGQASDVFFQGSNVLNFNDLTSGSLSAGNYTLFSSDVSGSFVNFSNLSIGTGLSGYSASLLQSGNNVVLNIAAVPEPGAWAAVGGFLGFLAIGRRIRNRKLSA